VLQNMHDMGWAQIRDASIIKSLHPSPALSTNLLSQDVTRMYHEQIARFCKNSAN